MRYGDHYPNIYRHSTHFIEVCKHGRVMAQCRCPGEKRITVVENCSCSEGITD